MSQTTDLTIAIATFNRAVYVTGAIESLSAQANTSGRWRVVVIDNNSTDDTAMHVARLAAAWPRLTLVHEPVQGLSHARNRALASTPEGYILYADDECKFPADYVDRALAIVDQRRPAVFGGPIHPWYPTPPPAWWLDDYGSFSLPWQAARGGRIYLSGGNIGFAVEALRAVGGFDPGLGMKGNAIRFVEETAVELAILARYGPERIWFDPDFVNFHAVRPEKFRWSVLAREHFFRGMARAEIAASGALAPAQEPVPDCLRPRPPPADVAARRTPPSAHAMRLLLAGVRRAGGAWFRLPQRGR